MKKKRRRSFPKTGEVFSIPLPTERYAYLHAYQDAGVAVLTRIDNRSSFRIDDSDVRSVRFFAKALPDAVRDRDWPQVGKVGFDDPSEAWVPPTYVRLSRNSFWIVEKDKRRQVSAEDIAGLDRDWILSDSVLVRRIESRLPDPPHDRYLRPGMVFGIPLQQGGYAVGLSLYSDAVAVNQVVVSEVHELADVTWQDDLVLGCYCAVLNPLWEKRWPISEVKVELSDLQMPEFWVIDWHDPDKRLLYSSSGFRPTTFESIKGRPSGELFFETGFSRRVENDLAEQQQDK